MLRIMSKFSDLIEEAIENKVNIDNIIEIKSREILARMGTLSNKDFDKKFKKIEEDMENEIKSLIKEAQ
jgi:vacuolar-type H+-ATPase catalytic subunit A/Vma1